MRKFINNVKRVTYNKLIELGTPNIFYDININEIKSEKKSDTLLILGTGPSLNSLNKNIIDSVDTLSVNGYAKLVVEKGWPTTDFYLVQDLEVSEKISHYIAKLKSSVIISSYLAIKNKNLKNYKYLFNHHFLTHAFTEQYKPYTYKKSHAQNKYIYDGYTVVYTALELAEFMGYKNVILLGVDANYSHNVESRNIININKVDKTYASAGERIIFSIKNFQESCSTHLNIYNASKSSALTFLEFKDDINGNKICL
ncbi:6-hydroxymethylpterin diphosphokinase MptE-like protein [Thalassomonas sp. M1454]|uniref:6-hydroxymethylpterin diphosphokinase MptE-like protein n=1 Tax=Thalassomonas sp. M1454 TaxID=2594477 RepID=UPI00163DC589|nr:6-hydroxymethylpterin diphosphokinase MptE-like protein [Thalassomonas sp. M1454]